MLTTIKIIVLLKFKLKRPYLTDHHGKKQANDTIRRINNDPIDSVVCFIKYFPLDGDISNSSCFVKQTAAR